MSLGKKKMLSQGGAAAPVGTDNFQVITYTGNGGTQSTNSLSNQSGTLGFQPDFVWIKARSSGFSSAIYDSVRGATYRLVSNTNDGSTSPTTNGLTAFNTNGFTLGGNNTSSNGSGTTYVAWNWYAPTSETNTSGTITSTIKKNVDAGFSIVGWTHGSGSQSIGHGLSQKPDMIIVKKSSGISDFWIWHKGLSSETQSFIQLNNSNAAGTSTLAWDNKAPTALVFYLREYILNASDTGIAYCFHSVAGYQSVGSYEGNGNATGPIVTTGFRPRFLMIKNADSSESGGAHWLMYDSERSTSNPRDKRLYANLPQAEAQNAKYDLDFNNNGFQIKSYSLNFGYNNLNQTYIYLAIA